MAGATSRYQFPYPTGTDRVADGDNAIQALAQQMESVLATNRQWTVIRGNTDGFANDTYVASHNLAFPGLPNGAYVGIMVMVGTAR